MKNKGEALTAQLQKAKDDALRYISYRPRTVREVNIKLADKGYDHQVIALVISFLQEYAFLNDEEFARFWIREREKVKPCGTRRIYCELMQKGVEKGIIESCLNQISPEHEEETAAALMEKKCRNTPFNYNKIKGFLLRRGFSPVIVRNVLVKYFKNVQE